METVIVVVGPTASGKSELALSLALELGGEIVSADSVQVYRGMDIGTAKTHPSERKGIPHHLIDVVSPADSFTVAQYQALALDAIRETHARGCIPVLVGGSGLYINSVTHDLDFGAGKRPDPGFRSMLEDTTTQELYEQLADADPESAKRIHPRNRPRIIRALEVYRAHPVQGEYDFGRLSSRYRFEIIGLNMERTLLYHRINQRVRDMIGQGLPDEAARLYERYGDTRILQQAIGYKELLPYLNGKGSLEDAIDQIQLNTRRFAKRQLTWFRKDHRIIWHDAARKDKVLADTAAFIKERLALPRKQGYSAAQ